MGMSIKTNALANNIRGSLSGSTRDLETNMMRLASGLRINSAKDDAAGLAISESLKAQIASLGQASRNSSDAISALQIGEGAMGEVANTLVRMRELAMQSASGQLANTQRAGIDAEIGRRRPLRVGLDARNILNTAHREYTSLLRYYADQPGRDIRVRVGMDF